MKPMSDGNNAAFPSRQRWEAELRDPLVPFFHEAEFAAIVAKQNGSGRLLQRSYDAFGHCAFTTAQMVDAFQSMEGWVRTGQKPAN